MGRFCKYDDISFDFVNTKPSKFFTICILATSHKETDVAFRTAVRRTLRHKLNPPGKRNRMVEELTRVEHFTL